MDLTTMPVTQRREYLKLLVSSLTRFEVRELLQELSKHDFRMDIFGNLPFELQIQVARHIDGFGDVFSCLRVSRGWKQIWLQEDVAQAVCKRLIPELVRFAKGTEALTGVRQALTPMYLDQVTDWRFRRLGKFCTAYVSSVPDDVDWSRTHSRYYCDRDRIQYNNGRITWEPPLDTPCIVVENLRTRTQATYIVDGLYLWGGPMLVRLGDRLLVAAAGRTLDAWDLDTNEHDSVALPSYVTQVRTAGRRIWLSFVDFRQDRESDSANALWVFGRGIKPFTPGMVEVGLNDRVEVLFHPLDDSVLWMVVYRTHTWGIDIHKFRDGVFCDTTRFRALVFTRYKIQSCLRKTNRYGEYLIASYERQITAQHGQHRVVNMICFDTLEGTLTTRQVDTVQREEEMGSVHHALWDDQLYSYRTNFHRPGSALPPEGLVVVTKSGFEASEPTAPTVPVYSAVPSSTEKGGKTLRRKLTERKELSIRNPQSDAPSTPQLSAKTQYCFAVDTSLTDTVQGRDVGDIWADESFVVATVNGRWEAWSFDADPEATSASGQSAESPG